MYLDNYPINPVDDKGVSRHATDTLDLLLLSRPVAKYVYTNVFIFLIVETMRIPVMLCAQFISRVQKGYSHLYAHRHFAIYYLHASYTKLQCL